MVFTRKSKCFLCKLVPAYFTTRLESSVKTTLISELILIAFSSDRADQAVIKGQCFVAYRGLDLKIALCP